MPLKLLILGLPGSGKSSVARYIATYLEDKNWGSNHFSDHVILQNMFQTDSEGTQFRPADHGGFDILDLNVFDIALQILEQEIIHHPLFAKQKEILLIEFARNNYRRAFQQFSDTFLRDASFLYLDVDSEKCKKRIHDRIANPSTQNDFYVSEYIFNTYYNKDDGQDLPHILASDYGIEKKRVKIIDNNGSLSSSIAHVYQLVDTMCGLEPL